MSEALDLVKPEQDLDVTEETKEKTLNEDEDDGPPTASPAAPETAEPGYREVEYRYLTFDTELPTRPIPGGNATGEIPPPPDLKDYTSPFNWRRSRKQIMTWLSCSVNITAAYSAGSYAAPASQLTQKWGISTVAYNTGITIFTAGFGVAPMVLAPFSEINGRRPVFISTGILFVICQIGCALTDSFGGMLIARWWLGVGGSTFSTMVGGILADIWETEERNDAMVLFTGATLFGTGLGPLVSGFVAQNLLWRWVFYIQIITSGTLVALVTLFFKETRGSVLLSRKAKILNRWYEQLEESGCEGIAVTDLDETTGRRTTACRRIRWKVKADEDRASLGKMIAVSLYRPISMLFTESVVFWFALWISFSWAVLYLQFDAFPLVYATTYNFDLQESGAIFTAVCIGGIISTLLCTYQEKWAVRRYPEKFKSPEGRLYFTGIQAVFLPIGIIMFGWTIFPWIHWIVPTIAVVFMTMGIFSIYLAVFNYSADVYHIYASSAIAGPGLCRNLLGGSFPLVTVQMFQGMGFHAASSLLFGIGAFLSAVPWVLIFYGPNIRARSKLASQFVNQ